MHRKIDRRRLSLRRQSSLVERTVAPSVVVAVDGLGSTRRNVVVGSVVVVVVWNRR